MGRYLLDTHVVLWWLGEPERLSPAAREVIADGRNELFFSAASAWEMAVKRALGRLSFPGNLEQVLRRQRIAVLLIALPHALAAGDLAAHHADPFDRMLVAQAGVEGLEVVTRDAVFDSYGVGVVRA
ncbi:MAG: type II toxin-antitoxin system VapC family toxin [Planctomycetes bacterium]|nr:type II toxin-antitoxin system VapC family toxin [Planctomycetota bacterium]